MSQPAYEDIKVIPGSITEPEGFLAAGMHIGIKRKRRDLCLIKSLVPATAAGVFTQNLVKASCVERNQALIKNKIKGIVVNSGIANTCTGQTGRNNNEQMAKVYAESLLIEPEAVLTASTGVIGSQLPINKISEGIKELCPQLAKSHEASKNTAEAIMTTDTYPKEFAVETEISGIKVKIGGIAKGSGMIHPNMATMLSFITTDVDISQEMLQKALKETVDDTYNMISVDGDTSTNDMVIVLANGQAGNRTINEENREYFAFKKALYFLNMHLAKEIVKDGEGVTKVIEVHVSRAASKEGARQIAKSIINSNLVKTAMFGSDANWGRILCAAGYSGVNFNTNSACIEFSSTAGSVITFLHGEPIQFDEEKAKKVLKEPEVRVLLTLGDGREEAFAWGCDLSYEYVRINGVYRT